MPLLEIKKRKREERVENYESKIINIMTREKIEKINFGYVSIKPLDEQTYNVAAP